MVSRKDLTATRNAKHLERCGVLVKVVREEGTDGGNFDGAEEQRAMFGVGLNNFKLCIFQDLYNLVCVLF